MEDYFIGYLLDALDERTKRQVEAYLTRHPDAREKLALLEHALEPLAADKDAFVPPTLLVERTLAKVAEHICTDRRSDDLPQAPLVTPSSLASGRSWWRRVDVLVAACLLFTVTGVGLMVLGRLRGICPTRSPPSVRRSAGKLADFRRLCQVSTRRQAAH